jgi:hypothetical protein
MALLPSERYPSQVTVDLGHPYGKAKNDVVVGDKTGTPLEKDWVNDIWGFHQALLQQVNIVPDGNPDANGASQHLDALNAIIAAAAGPLDARLDAAESSLATALAQLNALRTFACFELEASAADAGERFALDELLDSSPSGNFSINDRRVTLPAPGTYELSVFGTFHGGEIADASPDYYSRAIRLQLDGTVLLYSDDIQSVAPAAFSPVNQIVLSTIAVITATATQRVNVVSAKNGMIPVAPSRLIVKRLL